MRMYNSFVEIETEANGGVLVANLPGHGKLGVDDSSKKFVISLMLLVSENLRNCCLCPAETISVQVEEGQQVQFSLDHATLPCPTQSIKIRDGRDVWMSELISEFSGWGEPAGESIVISSGNLLLIDFHMNDSQIANTACYAGFIAHVEVIGNWIRTIG